MVGRGTNQRRGRVVGKITSVCDGSEICLHGVDDGTMAYECYIIETKYQTIEEIKIK